MPAKLSLWSWAQSNYESWSLPNPRPDNRHNDDGGGRVGDGEDDDDYEDIADDDNNADVDRTSIIVSVTRLPAAWEYLASPKLCFPLPSGLRNM